MEEKRATLPSYHRNASLFFTAVYLLLCFVIPFNLGNLLKFSILALFFLVTSCIYLFSISYKLSKNPLWYILRTGLFTVSLFALMSLLPSTFFVNSYILASGILYFLFFFSVFGGSEEILRAQFISSFLFFSLSLNGWLNHYYRLPITYFFLIALLGSFIIVRSCYESSHLREVEKNFQAFLISCIGIEVLWALSFLPLHFSVVSIIYCLSMFFFWNINMASLNGVLNNKKLIWETGLLVLFSIVSLIFTQWTVIQ